MKIRRSKNLKKQFKKLPKHVVDNFVERLSLFLVQPNHPSLNNHKLNGKYKNSRSLNITGDYRLIITKTENSLDLETIGTHSELY